MGASPEPAPGAVADQIAAMQPRLFRFALTLTRDREDAADLAQDTLTRALAAQWRFAPGTNLAAWLFRIMRNLHLNRLRDGAARPVVQSLDDVREAAASADLSLSTVERAAIERARLAAVREAFALLPERYAAPIHLVSVEGLSYAEVAGVLDVPIGTVMSRIYRGRRMLVATLGGLG